MREIWLRELYAFFHEMKINDVLMPLSKLNLLSQISLGAIPNNGLPASKTRAPVETRSLKLRMSLQSRYDILIARVFVRSIPWEHTPHTEENYANIDNVIYSLHVHHFSRRLVISSSTEKRQPIRYDKRPHKSQPVAVGNARHWVWGIWCRVGVK